MSTVIDHVGSSHGRACLQEVDAQSLAASGNVLCTYIILSQCSHCALANGISRNCSNEFSFMAVVCKGNCHICLAAAVIDVELVCLDELLIVWGG